VLSADRTTWADVIFYKNSLKKALFHQQTCE
jgi:hypothetical protein